MLEYLLGIYTFGCFNTLIEFMRLYQDEDEMEGIDEGEALLLALLCSVGWPIMTCWTMWEEIKEKE